MSLEKKPREKVCCGKCNYFLAMSDRDEISIRYKDLYVYFFGGMFIIACRGCGAQNYVIDDEFERLHPEITKRARQMVNSVEAKNKVWVGRKEYESNKGVTHVQ